MDINKTQSVAMLNAAAQKATTPPTPEQLHRHQQLVKATQEFEAVFIGAMLKQMRKSMAGDKPLFGGGQEAKMYQEMMDDATAQQLSRTGSFGLSKLLTKSLERNNDASS